MAGDHMDPKRITRAELYEQVWHASAVKVAQKYGVSDVAIHKICEKHQIPKPPRGYWAQVEYGKEMVPPPLPPISDPSLEVITIQNHVHASLHRPDVPQEKIKIPVADRLTSPHPLVDRTRRWHEIQRSRGSYLANPDAKADRLNIAVSDRNLPRALRLWDALLKALESRGWTITVEGDYWRPKTALSRDGVRIYVRMLEKSIKVPHVPTIEERERTRKYPHSHSVPEEDVKLTDALIFAIDDQYMCGARRPRADGPKGRLEERLGDFVRVLDEELEVEKVRQKEIAERQRQWQEQERRRKEEEQKRLEEEKRAKELHAMADAWHASEKIRAFLDAAEDAHQCKHGSVAPDSELGQWLAWARQYVVGLNPIKF